MPVRTRLAGWRSRHRETTGGAVQSEQRVEVAAPVVEFSEDGARALGRWYWDEVERSTFGLVRRARGGASVRLCLFGRGPALLAFAEPEVVATPALVQCRFAIVGGLLARRPQGDIAFAQARPRAELVELSSAIRDFVPALGARPGGAGWTGALYDQLQRRLHVFISRRYFERLARAAGP